MNTCLFVFNVKIYSQWICRHENILKQAKSRFSRFLVRPAGLLFSFFFLDALLFKEFIRDVNTIHILFIARVRGCATTQRTDERRYQKERRLSLVLPAVKQTKGIYCAKVYQVVSNGNNKLVEFMNRQKTEQKGRLIYQSISLYQISFMKMREIDISEVDGRVYEENCFHIFLPYGDTITGLM